MHDARIVQNDTMERRFSELRDAIRQSGHHDELMRLWRAGQGGPAQTTKFDLITHVIPDPKRRPVKVLDLCCGPGGLGRAFAHRFEDVRLDSLDVDPLLLAMCALENDASRTMGRTFLRDCCTATWRNGLEAQYDIICVATALHWFSHTRLSGLLQELSALIPKRGVLVFNEPVSPAHGFLRRAVADSGDGAWQRFWDYVRHNFGYVPEIGEHQLAIGDDGLPALEYVRLLAGAGFSTIDIIDRDADSVTVAARKD